MITIRQTDTGPKFRVFAPGVPLSGFSCHHIVADKMDRETPGWADYERGTLKTRLLGQGRVFYYPDVEARELLHDMTGVDLPEDIPLSAWESVVVALQKAQHNTVLELDIESLAHRVVTLIRRHE